jgi:hypothetical protein
MEAENGSETPLAVILQGDITQKTVIFTLTDTVAAELTLLAGYVEHRKHGAVNPAIGWLLAAVGRYRQRYSDQQYSEAN